MNPAAAKPFPKRLVYFPTVLKKLFIISFLGMRNDFGNPSLVPLSNPKKKPKL